MGSIGGVRLAIPIALRDLRRPPQASMGPSPADETAARWPRLDYDCRQDFSSLMPRNTPPMASATGTPAPIEGAGTPCNTHETDEQAVTALRHFPPEAGAVGGCCSSFAGMSAA